MDLTFLGFSANLRQNARKFRRFFQKSRGWIEKQVGSAVDQVYPTENLYDLFDKFPDGFKIRSVYCYKEDSSASYRQKIELTGNKNDKTIKGTLKNTKTPGDGEAETVLQESEIEYTSQGYVILNGLFKFNDIYFSKFLFQSLTLDKEKLSKYTMSDKDYSFETGSFSIDYNVRNNTVNKFFNLSPNSEVNLYIGMAGEESNGFGLSIKAGSLDYYESVGE